MPYKPDKLTPVMLGGEGLNICKVSWEVGGKLCKMFDPIHATISYINIIAFSK